MVREEIAITNPFLPLSLPVFKNKNYPPANVLYKNINGMMGVISWLQINFHFLRKQTKVSKSFSEPQYIQEVQMWPRQYLPHPSNLLLKTTHFISTFWADPRQLCAHKSQNRHKNQMGKRFTRTNLPRLCAGRMSTQHRFQRRPLIYNTDVFSKFSFLLTYGQSAGRIQSQLLTSNTHSLNHNNNNSKNYHLLSSPGNFRNFSRLYGWIAKSRRCVYTYESFLSWGYNLVTARGS